MRNILAPRNAHLLARMGSSMVLLAFDFDGTLAPIVAERDRAAMRPKTNQLFSAACDLYPCAVITGRGRDDVLARLAPARVKYVVGNHGLEPHSDLALFAAQVAENLPRLEASLSGHPGLEFEDKGYSIAVHYRRSRQRGLARQAIAGAASALPAPMRLIPGKLVVNLVPVCAPHKGDALRELRALEGAQTALYVGDDATDEDVFRLGEPERLLSVRVGQSRSSAAAFFLRSQRDIDDLLRAVVASRGERLAS